jgi:U3 small nucleolar RNA-associated protein 22
MSQSLFNHPTDDYDVIVELDPAVLPKYAQSVNFNDKTLGKRGSLMFSSSLPHVDFDPARLLCNDLQVYSG